VLTLELHTHGGLPVNAIALESLRFFLDGEPALMHLLYEMLLSNALGVRVGDGSEDPARTRVLPASCLQPVGFGRDEGMLGMTSAHSWAIAADRILLLSGQVPVCRLAATGQADQPAAWRQAGLQIMLETLPDSERHHRLLAQLQAQHLKLGCTPIVNLFQQPGEPIRVTHQKASYPVVVDARKPLAYEVVQLQRVVRVEKSAEGERSEEVAPFYATRHGSHLKAPRFYWHASRENSRRQVTRAVKWNCTWWICSSMPCGQPARY
jgi:type VI secretion system protein ImpG